MPKINEAVSKEIVTSDFFIQKQFHNGRSAIPSAGSGQALARVGRGCKPLLQVCSYL
jgi:hypothetical protein